MTLGALLLLAVFQARGADPVLHGGDAEAALALAVRDTTRPAEELNVTTLSELLRGRPTVLQGGGTVEVCARVPASPASFSEALGRAESAMAFLEYDAALKELDEAEALLGCLSAPADPGAAARMYFLRGLVFFFSQETLATREAWVQAHRFAAGLAWDDNFPPDGKTLFEEARAAAIADAPASLSLVPPLGDETLWVDGRPVTLSEGRVTVSAGDHLVQYGGSSVTTVRLALDAGADATLVFPHAVHDADVAWVADAGGRTVLSEVLSAALGPDAEVYAVYDQQVWEGKAGSADWVPLEQRFDAGAIPIEGPRRQRTWYVAMSGGGLAVAGGIAALSSYVIAKDAYKDGGDARSDVEFERQQQRYENARTAYKVSLGVGLAGLAVAGVGMAVPVSIGPLPEAPGVLVRVGR